jgi:hypothetical protein
MRLETMKIFEFCLDTEASAMNKISSRSFFPPKKEQTIREHGECSFLGNFIYFKHVGIKKRKF